MNTNLNTNLNANLNRKNMDGKGRGGKEMFLSTLESLNGFSAMPGQGLRRFFREDDGLGTVEIVLILAVLVGIALIFRTYISDFISEIMANIMGDSVADVLSNPLNK